MHQVGVGAALVFVRSQPISPLEGNEAAGVTFLTEEPGHEGPGAAFFGGYRTSILGVADKTIPATHCR